jgi:transcriptional regulator with XRE-family HTH domain
MQPKIRTRNYLANATEVAAACGCSRSTLYRVLRGARRPSDALRRRIECAGLTVPKRARARRGA